MSEPVEQGKTHPWHWPREWVRDEKFWREVTARALSGLIVAFIVFVTAGLAGFIRPTTIAWVLTLYIVIALILATVRLLGRLRGTSRRNLDNRKHQRFEIKRHAQVVAATAGIIAIIWLFAWLAEIIWK